MTQILASSLIPYLIEGLGGLPQHLARGLGVRVEDVEKLLKSYRPIDVVSELNNECNSKIKGTKVTPTLEVWISNYTEKSFIVGGDSTRLIKDDLKKNGGMWKPKLSRPGCGAWMWPITKKDDIINLLILKKITIDDLGDRYSNYIPSQQTSEDKKKTLNETKETLEEPSSFPFSLIETKDGKWWCSENELLFEKENNTFRCCGAREEIDGELLFLEENDVELLKKSNIEWIEDVVDTENEIDEEIDDDESVVDEELDDGSRDEEESEDGEEYSDED